MTVLRVSERRALLLLTAAGIYLLNQTRDRIDNQFEGAATARAEKEKRKVHSLYHH